MRKIILCSLLTAITLIPLTAKAADGTITFTGNIKSATCTINISPANANVILPTISTSALSGTGNQVAGSTKFSIGLSGCSAGIASATTYFEVSNPNIDQNTGYLKPASGSTATGVQIQLLSFNNNSGSYNSIALNQGPNSQNVNPISIVSGAGTGNYIAQYILTGTSAGQGSISTSATFTMVYP